MNDRSGSSNLDTTVIIPNYNGERYIFQTLNSLVMQTFKNFKVLVVDDGSTDNSLEIAREFQDRLPNFAIHQLENIGITANWNRGISMVNTEFFCILHCDDELRPEYLEKLRELLRKNPQAGIAHCAAMSIDEHSTPSNSPIEKYKINRYFGNNDTLRPLHEEYKLLLTGDYINCPSVFYRKSACDKIGLFNEEFRMVQDWEYWFRALLSGYKIAKTNTILFKYRRHGNNASVHHSADLIRYQEEFTLINWAFKQGIRSTFIGKNAKINFSLIIKTVIVDITTDLRQGFPSDAELKLQKVRSLAPATKFQPIYLFLRLCILLRKTGGLILDNLTHFYTSMARYLS